MVLNDITLVMVLKDSLSSAQAIVAWDTIPAMAPKDSALVMAIKAMAMVPKAMVLITVALVKVMELMAIMAVVMVSTDIETGKQFTLCF